MTLKKKILETDGFQLVRREATPKETCRAAYEVALDGCGKCGLKEPPDLMFYRAGHFCIAYMSALDEIAGDIYVDIGLAGGVVPGTIADIDHLSIEDAKRLADITMAQHEAATIMTEITSALAAWVGEARQKEVMGA